MKNPNHAPPSRTGHTAITTQPTLSSDSTNTSNTSSNTTILEAVNPSSDLHSFNSALDSHPVDADTSSGGTGPSLTHKGTFETIGTGDTITADTIGSVKTEDPLLGLAGAPTIAPLESVKSVVNGKRVLREEDAYEKTAYAWSLRRKWIILSVVAVCQTSMNFNAAIYSNAVEGINEQFGVTTARMGMVAFLVAYAFGCELWAPWSEELGRYSVMQLSLFFVNVSIIICAFAPNFSTIIAGRVIGGLSSAGGSVTLGMVADMFRPDEQQHAVLWASLWSCLGAVVGGIAGGPVQQYLSWRWNFYLQLIFSVSTQVLHLLIARETRATVLLDREAKRRRKQGEDREIWGPSEVKTKKERFNVRSIVGTMWRPYHMLLTEPIVLFLSLLSGFADALIFMFFESYGIVFSRWDFTPTQISLVLIALAGSYFLAYFSFFPIIARHNARRRRGEHLAPETRLYWLLFLVVLLPLGLLGSALTGTRSWIGVLVFTVPIGMANYAIYYATIDYMVAAYGEYSASATGGNGFARDFLAGMCALYTKPMFRRLGVDGSYFLLMGLSAAFCVPVYVFYYRGEQVRRRSKFAERLKEKRDIVGAKIERAGAGAGGVLMRERVGKTVSGGSGQGGDVEMGRVRKEEGRP